MGIQGEKSIKDTAGSWKLVSTVAYIKFDNALF